MLLTRGGRGARLAHNSMLCFSEAQVQCNFSLTCLAGPQHGALTPAFLSLSVCLIIALVACYNAVVREKGMAQRSLH